MHAATLHLIPILGAEKSKTAFYVAGGLLVAWALIVSLGIGLRNVQFPGDQAGERLVALITLVLVIATAATAIVTSGGSESKGASASAAPATTTSAPAETATTSESASASTTSTTASSTTGAPKAPSGKPAAPTPPASAPSAPLKLAANPEGQLAYDTKTLSATAGKVTIDFANASPVPHNVAIAQGSKLLGQTPIKTGSSILTLNLKPGTYTFYCAAPGHRQAGMEGTLKVS